MIHRAKFGASIKKAQLTNGHDIKEEGVNDAETIVISETPVDCRDVGHIFRPMSGILHIIMCLWEQCIFHQKSSSQHLGQPRVNIYLQ